MATTNYTYWDLGGCNCPCCAPCDLPGEDLSVSISYHIDSKTLTGSGTLEYDADPGNGYCAGYTNTDILVSEGEAEQTFGVGIYCSSSCSSLSIAIDGEFSYTWCTPSGCARAYTVMTLQSYTCSPLSMIWYYTNGESGGSEITLTITVTS